MVREKSIIYYICTCQQKQQPTPPTPRESAAPALHRPVRFRSPCSSAVSSQTGRGCTLHCALSCTRRRPASLTAGCRTGKHPQSPRPRPRPRELDREGPDSWFSYRKRRFRAPSIGPDSWLVLRPRHTSPPSSSSSTGMGPASVLSSRLSSFSSLRSACWRTA